MGGARPRLALSRAQILAHRRRAAGLDERRPLSARSLRDAAWAGLQDSMPRAAQLSLHARLAGVGPTAWEDVSFVQVWGPRFSAYTVAAVDHWIFTLGRQPDGRARRRGEDIADRLEGFLAGRRMGYGEAGHALGVHPNELRYAAPTGRVLIRWDGARKPAIWTVPAPAVDVADAKLELARRYFHVFGPGTADTFSDWAGVKAPRARSIVEMLGPELLDVSTPMGDRQILASDEASFRRSTGDPDTARLLPSGDTWFLLQGLDRELLVADPGRRASLWTPRVWPGAVLVDGEIAGTWRRAGSVVFVQPWFELPSATRDAVESEAISFPLPGLVAPIRVRWEAVATAESVGVRAHRD